MKTASKISSNAVCHQVLNTFKNFKENQQEDASELLQLILDASVDIVNDKSIVNKVFSLLKTDFGKIMQARIQLKFAQEDTCVNCNMTISSVKYLNYINLNIPKLRVIKIAVAFLAKYPDQESFIVETDCSNNYTIGQIFDECVKKTGAEDTQREHWLISTKSKTESNVLAYSFDKSVAEIFSTTDLIYFEQTPYFQQEMRAGCYVNFVIFTEKVQSIPKLILLETTTNIMILRIFFIDIFREFLVKQLPKLLIGSDAEITQKIMELDILELNVVGVKVGGETTRFQSDSIKLIELRFSKKVKKIKISNLAIRLFVKFDTDISKYFTLNYLFGKWNKSRKISSQNIGDCERTHLKKTQRKIEINPEYLFFIINRIYGVIHKNKVVVKKGTQEVKYEETIDIQHYMKTPRETLYDLIGVVIHTGEIKSGHYEAFVKYQTWYRFNDEKVKPVLNAQHKNATILVYKRK